MTDKPTPKEIEDLFVEETGFDTDDFPAAIFGFARAVLAKWGTPAGAGEPFGYFHQLLNHEGKGNGVWLGAAERKVVEQAHTPGETSEEIVTLYTTPQPDPAYSAACHLATALFKKHFAHLPDYASGQVVWGLCDSTAGVISQIDNMVSGLVQPAQAQADSVQEEAARLDFLIEQRAYVVSDPDVCPGYWLHWARPDGSTWVQCDEQPTPRAAIDVARKQEANHDR